jgi:preprotein translocase subunit YajC
MFDVHTHTLMFAQDGGPPPSPGESRTLVPGTPGDIGGPGASPAANPFGNIILIMFLVLGLMIVFSIMGQRRERKKREALIGAVKKNDRVQTVGGVVGTIVELKPDTVVLKVDEATNTRITFARSAIQQVLKSGD